MMKPRIIISRKGFDGTAGGIDSPIFENGKILSFPIPEASDINYDDLFFLDDSGNEVLYSKILKDLDYNFDKNGNTCHLDPDLLQHNQYNKPEKKYAIFGQADSAEGYLRKRVEVRKGDIFLFFGRFKKVIKNSNGCYEYSEKNSINVIWGYLQVGKILKDKEIIDENNEYSWHPHVKNEKYLFAEKNKKNTLYVASDYLDIGDEIKLDGKYKGYGVFKYSNDNEVYLNRVLTSPGESMSTWKYQKFYDDENIYKVDRKNSKKNKGFVQYLGQWQEIGLKNDDTDLYKKQLEWLKEIIECGKENIIE